MTMNFNAPAVGDNYSSAFVPNILAAFAALGQMLDPAVAGTVSNQTTGTKRLNAGLFEQWSGSVWAAYTMGYVLKAGDILTGQLTFPNNGYASWKDSGGTARTVVGVSSSNNVSVGDVGYAMAGSSLFLRATSLVEVDVNSVAIASFGPSNINLNKFTTITAGAGENVRLVNDSAFLSFYNTANTTRTGYAQGSTGSSLVLMAENGASLSLGTNATSRIVVDTSGNISTGGVTPSSSLFSGMTSNLTATLAGGPVATGAFHADGTFNVRIGMFADSTAKLSGWDTSYSSTYNGMVWRINSVEQMRLVNGIGLGIGRTPSGYGLDVAGALRLSPTVSAGIQIGLNLFDSGTGAGEGIILQWESTNRVDMARVWAVGNSTAGGDLVFATNAANTGSATEGMRLNASQALVFAPTSAYIGHAPTTGGLTVGANAVLADGTARIEFYDVSHATLAKRLYYRGDFHAWTASAASTPLMSLDGSGNLASIGSMASTCMITTGSLGFQAATYLANSRNPIYYFGNASTYGLSYFHGTSGLDGTNDSVGFHFGTATSVGAILSISGTGSKKGITVLGGAATARFAIGSQTTLTIDWSKSNYQTMTLTANVASGGWVFSNMQDGQTLTLKITQDATGSRTIAANTSIKWPGGVLGVLSTTANAVDLLCMTYDSATGFFYATLAKGFA